MRGRSKTAQIEKLRTTLKKQLEVIGIVAIINFLKRYLEVSYKTIKIHPHAKQRNLEENNRDWLSKLTVKRGMREVFRFWQTGPGYDRNINSENELFEKMHYIHNNPVRRGLVLTPQDWRWSSAGWYAGERDVVLAIDNITL